MKKRFILLTIATGLLFSCNNQKSVDENTEANYSSLVIEYVTDYEMAGMKIGEKETKWDYERRVLLSTYKTFGCESGAPTYRDWETDRKSTRLNSSHITRSRMPSSA